MPDSAEARRKRVGRNLRIAAQAIDALKLATGCIDCGYRAHPAALHFDHTDPDTKRPELGWRHDRTKLTSRKRLIAYLDHVQRYCVVRCANCHAARTVADEHWRIRRGATSPADPTLW